MERDIENVVLPGKGGRCAGQCQDPPRTGCPGQPNRRTTASSSPCNTHTAGARERDSQPHGRDTCTECEENKKCVCGGGGGGGAEREKRRGGEGQKHRERRYESESVQYRGHLRGWERASEWWRKRGKGSRRGRDLQRQRLLLSLKDREP